MKITIENIRKEMFLRMTPDISHPPKHPQFFRLFLLLILSSALF